MMRESLYRAQFYLPVKGILFLGVKEKHCLIETLAVLSGSFFMMLSLRYG